MTDERRRVLLEAFRMPSMMTLLARTSSITNAFVSALVPVKAPSAEEIGEALGILGMEPSDVRCAYCGDKSSEWDHLRPLVLKRRPTGYISEIANLVPSCGKCNQSKGNKSWREWIMSSAKLSPSGRGVAGVSDRVACLDAFERWRAPIQVDFERILGEGGWKQYWSLWENLIEQLRHCQGIADQHRMRIAESLDQGHGGK